MCTSYYCAIGVSISLKILLSLLSPVSSDYGWDLPLLPQRFPNIDSVHFRYNKNASGDGRTAKFIPNHVWIAFAKSPEDIHVDLHTYFMIQNNPNWRFCLAGNHEKQEFIDTVFNGTSIQWAYNSINDKLGNSKADLWRFSVLYVYGGLYLDDDSDLRLPFDQGILPNDKLIFGFEKNPYLDSCFHPDFHLSKASLESRDNSNNMKHLFHGGNLLVSWAIFSAPRHPIMLKAMSSVVEVLKYEYLVKSVMKKSTFDFPWKICMCATGPSLLTAAAAEVVIEKKVDAEYRIAGRDLSEFNGRFKVSSDRQSETHYMKLMQQRVSSPSLLRSYSTTIENGTLIQLGNDKTVYAVFNNKKCSIPDFTTFLAMNFSLSKVQYMASDQFENITLGEPLPSLH